MNDFNKWFTDEFGNELPTEIESSLKEDTKKAWDYQKNKSDELYHYMDDLLMKSGARESDLKEQNQVMREALERIINNSERHIQTSDDFWVFSRDVRMHVVIALEEVNGIGGTDEK